MNILSLLGDTLSEDFSLKQSISVSENQQDNVRYFRNVCPEN